MATVPQEKPVAVVMAAGKSTRMKSALPKVLHELCGQPLLAYVLAAINEAGIDRTLCVVGHRADLVEERFRDWPGIEFVLQAEQKGTGHAVMVCQPSLQDHRGAVLVIAGDQPLVRPQLISSMLEHFRVRKARALLATAVVADPTGLGRIVRDSDGNFLRIVEQKDADPHEAAIREINPSFYCFDGPSLFATLDTVRPNNAQNEYYLTDVPGILREQGEKVVAEILADEIDMAGVNHRRHLAEAHVLMQQRIQNRLMDEGVTIVDPRNTYIDSRARIGVDTVIHPFTVIRGPVDIGAGCAIGPFALVAESARLPDGAVVGPYQRIAAKGS